MKESEIDEMIESLEQLEVFIYKGAIAIVSLRIFLNWLKLWLMI